MRAGSALLKDWRLTSQMLGDTRAPSAEQAVSWLLGVQAQEPRWARWSLGLRTHGCTDADVKRAISSRRIVRAWLFRGTLHLVAAEDLSWLMSLLAPRIIGGNTRRYRQLGLDDATFARSQMLIRDAIESSGPLTRAELAAHLARGGVPARGQQVPHLLQRATLDGLICHGPERGSEPTFALVSDWVGTRRSFDREEALRQLAIRYFSSHGPATKQDFAWWAGLTAGDAASAITSAAELVAIDADGVRHWAVGGVPSGALAGSGHLLPRFDGYLLGYKQRSLALDPVNARAVNTGGGMPKPTAIVDGRVIGTWGYTTKKKDVVVTVEPFRRLGRDERDALRRAAQRLDAFNPSPVTLQLGRPRAP
jgi:DNA glycosylase AlkZ-like